MGFHVQGTSSVTLLHFKITNNWLSRDILVGQGTQKRWTPSSSLSWYPSFHFAGRVDSTSGQRGTRIASLSFAITVALKLSVTATETLCFHWAILFEVVIVERCAQKHINSKSLDNSKLRKYTKVSNSNKPQFDSLGACCSFVFYWKLRESASIIWSWDNENKIDILINSGPAPIRINSPFFKAYSKDAFRDANAVVSRVEKELTSYCIPSYALSMAYGSFDGRRWYL